MKTLKICVFAVLALAVTFTSCKKDDDNGATAVDNKIIGTWKWSGYEISNATSTLTTGVGTVTGSWNSTVANNTITVTFANPNAMTSTGTADVTINLTSAVFNDQVMVNGTTWDPGTWTRTGNTITTVSGGETDTYTIIEETNSTLRMTEAVNEMIQDSYGDPATIVGTATYTFTKQ